MNFTQEIANALDPNYQQIILFPTEQCNFRCTYCYEKYANKTMSPQMIVAIKKFLTQRAADLERLDIQWFGGEPLLALQTVLDISSHAKTLLSFNPKLKINGAMTTNAFLLNERTFTKLIAAGVTQYQISLDGPEEIHNSTRKLLNGKGTYAVIMKNLRNIKKIDEQFKILLRIHFSPSNRIHMDSFLAEITEKFGKDDRFSIVLKGIKELSETKKNECVLTWKEEEELFQNIAIKYPDLPFITCKNKKELCYAAKPNSFAVRADGTINRCTVILDDELNNIGKLNKEGQLDIDQRKASLWTSFLFSNETGGCPLEFVKRKKGGNT